MTETPAQSEEMARLAIHKGEEAEFRIGGLRFVACRREVGEIDGGISLYVSSDVPGDDRQLLRFDFFRTNPHYHAPAENRVETPDALIVGVVDSGTGHPSLKHHLRGAIHRG